MRVRRTAACRVHACSKRLQKKSGRADQSAQLLQSLAGRAKTHRLADTCAQGQCVPAPCKLRLGHCSLCSESADDVDTGDGGPGGAKVLSS